MKKYIINQYITLELSECAYGIKYKCDLITEKENGFIEFGELLEPPYDIIASYWAEVRLYM